MRTGKQPCGKYTSHPITDETIPLGGVETPMSNFEEEAADIFIRLCDLCGRLDIDLGRAVLTKMEYNSKRPHMHGGKRC